MKAGFAKAKITPLVGGHLLGFAKRDIEAPADSVHDDLFVRALYLEHAGEAALVMSYDLLFWARADGDRMLGALGRSMDLPPRQVLINFTHTHQGPALGTWGPAGFFDLVAPLYVGQLTQATLEAAARARSVAEAVTIEAGMTETSLPISRRRPDEQGRILFAPNPEARTCRSVPVCMLRGRDGQPVALLFSASCHASATIGRGISADYPGVAVREVNRCLGVDVAMFLQGCGGDAKPCVVVDSEGGRTFRAGTWDDVEKAGKMVADPVVARIERGLTPVEPALMTARRELRFPLQPPPPRSFFERTIVEHPEANDLYRLWARHQLERLDRGLGLATSAAVRLQGLKFGDTLRLIGLEGEPVADFAHWMFEAFPDGVTFPLGYTFSQGLYLPSERMLVEGGYEVDCYYEYGFPAPLAPGYEEVFKQGLRDIRASMMQQRSH